MRSLSLFRLETNRRKYKHTFGTFANIAQHRQTNWLYSALGLLIQNNRVNEFFSFSLFFHFLLCFFQQCINLLFSWTHHHQRMCNRMNVEMNRERVDQMKKCATIYGWVWQHEWLEEEPRLVRHIRNEWENREKMGINERNKTVKGRNRKT